jgi:quinol monooxygenase YgiN
VVGCLEGHLKAVGSGLGLGGVRFEYAVTRKAGLSMSVTSVTRFHAAQGQEGTLLELQSEGRRRMLAADGCESFDILLDQTDPRSSAFVQTWSSREAHDAAFGELIMASGHLEKVLATLDEGVVQTFYDVVS